MKNNEEPSALAPPRHHHIHDQHHHQQLHHYRPPPSTRISCASRRWKLIILESHTEVVVLSMSGPLTSHLSYFIKYTSMYCSLWGRSCTHNDLQHTAIYIYILIKSWKTSAVNTTVWMVETQLCKLRGTSYCTENFRQLVCVGTAHGGTLQAIRSKRVGPYFLLASSKLEAGTYSLVITRSHVCLLYTSPSPRD